MRRNLILFLSVLLSGCTETVSQYSSDSFWFHSGDAAYEQKADVFYLVSVNVLSATDSAGNAQMRCRLDENDRGLFRSEMEYARNMFGDSFRFFSPYYHQLTFEAVSSGTDRYEGELMATEAEVREAFNYYMEHFNGGRPFILAGFSLGALLSLDILKNMDEEQFSRLLAVYLIGYRLNAEDLKHPHVKAFDGKTAPGQTISFNSVQDTSGIFKFTTEGAACCTNPVNRRTDSTPAEFIYRGRKLTAAVDTSYNVLVVNGFEVDTTNMWSKLFPPKNLHHWDLLFYGDFLRNDAVERANIVLNK